MFKVGKKNLEKFKNIKWIKSSAENIPVKDDIMIFIQSVMVLET